MDRSEWKKERQSFILLLLLLLLLMLLMVLVMWWSVVMYACELRYFEFLNRSKNERMNKRTFWMRSHSVYNNFFFFNHLQTIVHFLIEIVFYSPLCAIIIDRRKKRHNQSVHVFEYNQAQAHNIYARRHTNLYMHKHTHIQTHRNPTVESQEYRKSSVSSSSPLLLLLLLCLVIMVLFI